ncbi:DUF2634 domain-containing protein [Fructobacillus tropaeoli]|uniref:Phage protein n=1 Tax=Fructobacillus tropaeoli TaxID=709323 RepID=A0A3F3H3F3_9LACO|nr:DUF2634 domain-containing protein [Fructobacillus tropaeoli]GAP04876.1 hypothetical protein FTRO_0110110 [Fructobacillus tropaeoli]
MASETMKEELLPSRTYEVLNGRIMNLIDGQEAMRQAIEKALQTQRYSVAWLSKNYGTDLEQLVGKSLDYAKSEVKRMISETFAADKRIIDVEVTNIDEMNKTDLAVYVNISTSFGKVAVVKEVTT